MAVRLAVHHPRSGEGEADEKSFEFEQARIVIGRSAGADVRLPGQGVSDTHATVEQNDGHYTVRDERSLNGTALNGEALVPSRPRALEDGDEIVIAEFSIRFYSGPLTRHATTPERTASLARRMLRELLGAESEASLPPYLHVRAGPDAGTRINLAEPPSRLTIGRGNEADLVLADVDVSRLHVEIIRSLDTTVARDLESKNGIEVNGKPLRERRLRHGDVLGIGSTSLLYQDPAERALKALEREPVRTLTRTQPGTAAAIQPEASGEITSEDAPPGDPEADSTRPASPVDYVVYGLALLVLAASIGGLLWLLL